MLSVMIRVRKIRLRDLVERGTRKELPKKQKLSLTNMLISEMAVSRVVDARVVWGGEAQKLSVLIPGPSARNTNFIELK